MRQRVEHRVFHQLLQLVPSLQERVFNAQEADILEIADLVRRTLLHTVWVAELNPV